MTTKSTSDASRTEEHTNPGASPKRQGDKLGLANAATEAPSEKGRTGDSPKRQGDKLGHAVEEAAKG